MTIENIITKKVTHVDIDDTLADIYELFGHASFHHLLVTQNNKLYGVISDRDLFKNMSPYAGTPAELPRDASIMNKRAHQIMTRKPVTVTKDTSIDHAVDLLLQHDISCLPVIDNNNNIEGIVTWKDLIKARCQ